MKNNFLTSATISEVLADETVNEAERVMRLAIVSLYGPEAPSEFCGRAMVIGKAVAAAAEVLKDDTAEGYPHGFVGALLNKNINTSLKGSL
jgi:hypothetical protein